MNNAPYPRFTRVRVTAGPFTGECGILCDYSPATCSYTVLFDNHDYGGTQYIDAADLEVLPEPN